MIIGDKNDNIEYKQARKQAILTIFSHHIHQIPKRHDFSFTKFHEIVVIQRDFHSKALNFICLLVSHIIMLFINLKTI